MFERLAEITATGEKYNLGHEGSDEPLVSYRLGRFCLELFSSQIFTWFPMKSDYEFIPAGVILNETVEQKVCSKAHVYLLKTVKKGFKSVRQNILVTGGTSNKTGQVSQV